MTVIERCCPYCRQPEDFTHLLNCADPRAQKFQHDARITLCAAISKTGETGSALLAAIQVRTVTPQETETIDPVRSSEKVMTAIAAAILRQEEIGWTNFFRGFVAMEWGIAGATGTVTTPGVNEQRSQSRATLMTYIVVAQIYTLHLWMSWNAVLYEAGSDSLDIAHATINNSITQLYNLLSTFSAFVQCDFAIRLEDRLKQWP